MSTTPPATIIPGKYRIPLFFALIAGGLAGNYFHYSIFLNIDFIFGSIFAMLALQFFGLGRGIAAAAIIAAYTYVLWNHPYSIVILTAEVAVVGLLMNRRKMGMVLADTLYWLIIGMPLVYIFYHFVMLTPPSNTYIVMAKQCMNGITNALAARILFSAYGFRSSNVHTSYNEIIYNLLVFFLICPALVMLTVSSRADFKETDKNISLSLHDTGQRLEHYIGNWLRNREATLVTLAKLAVSKSPGQVQPYLELVKDSDNNYVRIALFDNAALITASAPLVDELGVSAIGVSAADRPYIPILKKTLKPMLSEVVIGRIGTPKPRIFMLAPVVKDGTYGGFVLGSLQLEQIHEQLVKSLRQNTTLYTLLDNNGMIIMTNRSDQKLMSPLVRGKGELKQLDNETSQWVPNVPSNISNIERWKKSFYVSETMIGGPAGWKLILEQPVAPFQKKLYDNYTGKLTLLLLILFGSLALAEIVSRRSIAALQESKDRLARIIDGTNAGTWEWNVQTGETIFNEQWAGIIGYSLAEIAPVSIETWKKCAHPDDLQKSGELLEKHFRGELKYYECESRMKHKNGQWIWVLDRGSVASWSKDGKPLWMFGTHQEITGRKQAEMTAVEASMAKSRFLSIVAHEFYTPLHLLTISLDILERYKGRLSDEEQLEQHGQIRSAARQLSTLIGSVSAFNKQGNDIYPVSPEQLDIGQKCAAISHEVNKVWGEGHTFHVSIAADCGAGMMDATLFRSILVNLLTNAFRFTPPGGTISLSVTRHDGRVKMEIKDTGIGIPDEDQKRVFEAFFRGANVDARNGLGLGLSIVNDALKALNGNISLQSKVGIGTIFTVELPIISDVAREEPLS